MGLVLRAVDVAGPCRWRWLLIDERSGVCLAEHRVELDPGAAETEAFEDLYRFLRWRADPARRMASETELVHRVGAWIGSVVLGERIGRAIATAAPVSVRVVVPPGAEFLACRPLELAHIGGVPVAARGHVALVYDLPAPPMSVKAPVGEALRMLAVFSLPTTNLASGLRRERHELSRLVRRIAAQGRRRVELKIAQYGMTRAALVELAGSGAGWDVLHLSGHGEAGEFLLATPDGSVDPVSTAELIDLLRPLRPRLKLAVVSSCRSAAATAAEMLRRLGLDAPAADLETHTALDATAAPMAMARALVTQLDCAVIAMRYPVVEEFAAGFAEALYNRVFRNTQRLDRAVAAAVADAAGPVPSPVRPAISVATPTLFGTSAGTLSLTPPVGQPVPDPADEAMAWFPSEPPRFVGRAETMAAASTALAPASGYGALMLHGMVGAGKTASAVELAYRHRQGFAAAAFWSAPTDPDQCGDALRLLALALDAQLGDYGVAMVDKIATLELLENFLPTLTAALTDARLLLVLDNLHTLLTPDGQWRDLRWVPLIDALTSRVGPSRVILTSRVVPAGLNPDTVLVQPVHALSRNDSLLLARELPNLRALLHTMAEPDQAGRHHPSDPALGRCVLTMAQGHPALLELADAAAADRARLTLQLADVGAAADEEAFLTDGATGLDTDRLWRTVTAWTTIVATTLPAPSRLLLQTLCRIEETDRSTAVLGMTWAALWRRLEQPGEPPPLDAWIAPLLTAALITVEQREDPAAQGDDPADPVGEPADQHGPVRYRIHPCVVEAIQVATPEPVTATIDGQLADWWAVVGDWAIEQQQTGQDTSRLVVRAGLAAARYLLRRHDWSAATCLLERALIRDGYSALTSLAAIPLLRRIAEATGELPDLVVLASALRKVDPAEAETLLRRVYDQATTHHEYRLASTTTGDLISLLRDQGRLREALTLAGRKIEHTSQAGFGFWTQLSDQGRRLQILDLLGHHEQVLIDLPGLLAHMAELPEEPGDNDRVNPWNVREGILDVGRCSAVALQRWDKVLRLNHEIIGIRRRRGASPHDIAISRFNDSVPLLQLGRLAEADQLLRDCQDVFETAGDAKRLAEVHGSRAELEGSRGHPVAAVDFQRTALRLRYFRPDPREISTAHHNLADYLFHASGRTPEQRAHRLIAALLHHLTGDTHGLIRTLRVLADELHTPPGGLETPTLPTTLAEIINLVDTGARVRSGTLVVTLCPDPATAEHALTDLLTTAATATDQPEDPAPVDTAHLIAAWAPIITAVGTAATNGDTPAGLTDLLDDIATTDWAALAVALRRVLAGDRSRGHLLAGLDPLGTAILTATLAPLSEGDHTT